MSSKINLQTCEYACKSIVFQDNELILIEIGISNVQYSYSAAINLFSTVINFILLILVNQISKKVSDNSLW